MNSVDLVLTQLGVFAVMIFIGIIGIKIGALEERYLSGLSTLIMRLILPIMIFTKVINGATRNDLFSCGIEVLLSTLLLYGILFVNGFMLTRIFSLKGNYGRIFWASSMFGNIGFIGIPLIFGILPERGMLYMAFFSIIDQIFLWSIGFYLTLPVENTAHTPLIENLKHVFNPATFGIALAIFFICMEWKLPPTVNKALIAIGDSTTPLSLIYIGASFCFCDVKRFLTRIEYYALVVVKMILIPLLMFSVLSLLHVQQEIVVFITILSGMPSMAMTAMFARLNKSDEECSIGAIMITTVSCLVTLPIVAYITNF